MNKAQPKQLARPESSDNVAQTLDRKLQLDDSQRTFETLHRDSQDSQATLSECDDMWESSNGDSSPICSDIESESENEFSHECVKKRVRAEGDNSAGATVRRYDEKDTLATIVADDGTDSKRPSFTKGVKGKSSHWRNFVFRRNNTTQSEQSLNRTQGRRWRSRFMRKRKNFTFRVKSQKKEHRSGVFDSIDLVYGKIANGFREFCCTCGAIPDVQLGEEFLGEEAKFKTLHERLLEEWKSADTNGDGHIEASEMKAMLDRLNVRIPYEEVVNWIREYDLNGDGVLAFDEFELMFAKLQSLPDLRREFLCAVYREPEFMNHSDSELETETKTLDKMYILPTDLAWFFYWSSNGDYAPSEEACSVFIRIYSPNKAINPTPKKLAKPSLDKVTEKRFNKMKTTFRSMKNFHAARSPTKLSSPKRSEHNGDTFEADLQMSYETFVVMLADVHQNRAGNPKMLDDTFQDMTQPLSHYFISSSHNSYLLGNQLNSVSSPVAVERALKLGVRIIELDAWNGDDGNPIVTHGYTLCKPTSFKECIESIRKFAFVTTEYPCIVTIENHCSMKQQRVQVELMDSILGDMLFRWEDLSCLDDDDPALRNSGPMEWLSPEDLKGKIVIRDRPQKKLTKSERNLLKMPQTSSRQVELTKPNTGLGKSPIGSVYEAVVEVAEAVGGVVGSVENIVHESANEIMFSSAALISGKNQRAFPQYSEEEKNSATMSPALETQSMKVTTICPGEAEPGAYSDTVLLKHIAHENKSNDAVSSGSANIDARKDGTDPSLLRLMYIRNIPHPRSVSSVDGEVVHSSLMFIDPGFVSSSSLAESKLRKIAKPGSGVSALCSYAKRHLIRVFPDGRRIASSNFDPMPVWLSGCQIAALNYQKFGWKVWLNEGMFRMNGKSGYVLKPSQMLNAVSTGIIDAKKTETLPTPSKAYSSVGDESLTRMSDKMMQITGHDSFSKEFALPWTLKPNLFSKREFCVTIISGHYLPRSIKAEKSNRKQITNPYVEVSLHGLMEKENEFSHVQKTSWVKSNGFNPRWNETFKFDVLLPELSLLSLVVRSKDSTAGGKKKGSFVAQQVIPLLAIRTGFRVVALNFFNGAPMDGARLFCRFYWS